MLAAIQISKAKAKDKPYKLPDGRGLYLEVRPTGAKFWRYRFELPPGKESIFTIGEYPAVSLAEARDQRDWARQQVRQGINPTTAREDEKRRQAEEQSQTFEKLAKAWVEAKRADWSAGYLDQVETILAGDVYPRLGQRPAAKISAKEVLDILRPIEDRGASTIAVLARQHISAIFRYGIAAQACSTDPTASLAGALKRRPVRHHPHLTLEQIPALKQSMRSFGGFKVTRLALELLLLVFARPSELRQGEWEEMRWDDEEWRPAPERMKMRRAHIVPLSRQALALFRELHALTGNQRFMFPNLRDPRKCMSITTMNTALARMGYGGQFSSHGFRGTASTALHEMGFPSDHIEVQLAHADQNSSRRAYNHALYLPERRVMMQAWADKIDSLCSAKETASGA